MWRSAHYLVPNFCFVILFFIKTWNLVYDFCKGFMFVALCPLVTIFNLMNAVSFLQFK